jgi:hypothetical protein
MSSGRIGMRSPAKSGNLPGVRATEGMTHDYDYDADAAVDEFFTRLTARFEADPERDRFDDWTLTVVLARN